jgi:hypothetical protein
MQNLTIKIALCANTNFSKENFNTKHGNNSPLAMNFRKNKFKLSYKKKYSATKIISFCIFKNKHSFPNYHSPIEMESTISR